MRTPIKVLEPMTAERAGVTDAVTGWIEAHGGTPRHTRALRLGNGEVIVTEYVRDEMGGYVLTGRDGARKFMTRDWSIPVNEVPEWWPMGVTGG